MYVSAGDNLFDIIIISIIIIFYCYYIIIFGSILLLMIKTKPIHWLRYDQVSQKYYFFSSEFTVKYCDLHKLNFLTYIRF